MALLDASVTDYLKKLTKVEDSILVEMEEFGESKNFPYVEPEVGKLLLLLAKSINARRVFELGSGYGYSAAWFLKAFPENEGEIICTDFSDENIAKGYEYFERLGAKGRITYMKGDAIESLKKTEGPFDIIYNDLDKHDYPKAFEAALPMVRSGGFFIADNALWSGRIFEENPDENSRAILKFNEMIHTSPDVISVIVPIRDGVAISLKR